MGIARREWVAVAAAAGVVLAVGCGLSLSVDESPSEDAGADGTKPPSPIDGEAPDVLLPDGALPDGATPDGAIPDAWVDDGAVFLPSNLDAAAATYSFDGGTSLRDLLQLDVMASAGTATVTMKTVDGGTAVLPPEDVRYDAECECVVVSVKDWAVPVGSAVVVQGDVPLVVIASGDVRIDGTVRVSSVTTAVTAYDGNAAVGTGGGGGGGGATPGGAGGGATGADGGGTRSPRKVPSLGAHGGVSGGRDAPGFNPCGHGGLGGGALQVFAKVLHVGPTGSLTAVGEGAGRGCPGTGGGGGGSGGTIVLEGRVADISGTVLATGGGGAGGAGAAVGGGPSAPGASGGVKGGIGGDGGTGGGKGGNGGDTAPPSDGGPGTRGGGGGGRLCARTRWICGTGARDLQPVWCVDDRG